MRYWLYKSEPAVYGIDHLERDGTTIWDGVRSYQARNNLIAAAVGDRVFFYHASADPPGIAGLAEVVETDGVDPLQFDPASKYFDPTSKPDRSQMDDGQGRVRREVRQLPPPGMLSRCLRLRSWSSFGRATGFPSPRCPMKLPIELRAMGRGMISPRRSASRSAERMP